MRTVKSWLGIALGLSLTTAAWAQPEWGQTYLPDTTELYLEYQPRVVFSEGPGVLERLQRSPFFRVISNALPLEPALLEELKRMPLWNGRLIAAVVREGPISPLEHWHRGNARAAIMTEFRYQADLIFTGVNQYRKLQKRFPKTVADLRAKGYYDGELPEGAQAELLRSGKKMSVRIRLPMAAEAPVEVTWPDPGYTGVQDFPALQGLFIGVGVPDSARLQATLQRWDPDVEMLAPEGDHWSLAWDTHKIHMYLHKDWVYLSSSPALVQPFLAGHPPAQSLRANPRFALQYGRLNRPDTESWLFADLQDILQTSPMLTSSAGVAPERILMRSLGHAAGSRLNGGMLEATGEGFLQWDGVQNVNPALPAAALTLANRIPAGTETVFWLDLPGLVRVSDRLGGEFPIVNTAIQFLWPALEQGAGLSVPREALAQGSQLYLYYEVADLYATQIEAIVQLFGAIGGREEGDAEDLLAPSRWPILAVLEVSNPALAAQVQAKLTERLGEAAVPRSSEGVAYRVSKDGRVGHAVVGTTQVWASGHTERLLPRTVRALQGSGPALASTPGYQRFAQGRQGELLLYLHAKADRTYSLLKGFLLYLGSDFRPEAEILGRLRDTHVSLEVVPGGISLRSALFSDGYQAVEAPGVKETEENRE
jgi:hypothetical protein